MYPEYILACVSIYCMSGNIGPKRCIFDPKARNKETQRQAKLKGNNQCNWAFQENWTIYES